jgi:hypothetical protein
MTPLNSMTRLKFHMKFLNCFTISLFRKENFVRKILVVSEESMTRPKSFQRGWWPRRNRFSGVNVPAETISVWVNDPTAGSLTPLKFEYCRFFRWISGHMQNGFSPWIRAQVGVDWWSKSLETVPLKVDGASRIWGPKSQRCHWHRCAV